MKIHDQLPWTEQQKSVVRQATTFSFKDSLEDYSDLPLKKIASPTKQSTGDEYYWQHLNDLQQSRLNFDAKYIINRAHKSYALINEKPVFNASTPSEIKQKPEQEYIAGDCINSISTIHSMKQKPAPLLIQIHDDLETSPLPNMQNTTQWISKQCDQSKETKIPSYPHQSSLFKNCHLFVEEEQVELTFNSKDLNTKEQNELICLIQDYLKRKGLVLNRLIINGVKHD